MAEDLANYYSEVGVRCRYMHSEIETLERIRLLRDLRRGEYDVLIGINLLREGLDLPEVSLVAILDADKEGFLRSQGSLIQTIGRAARHLEGRAILYADKMTDSMQRAIDETNSPREKQELYNEENGIQPTTIIRAINDSLAILKAEYNDLTSITWSDYNNPQVFYVTLPVEGPDGPDTGFYQSQSGTITGYWIDSPGITSASISPDGLSTWNEDWIQSYKVQLCSTVLPKACYSVSWHVHLDVIHGVLSSDYSEANYGWVN